MKRPAPRASSYEKGPLGRLIEEMNPSQVNAELDDLARRHHKVRLDPSDSLVGADKPVEELI